MIGNLSAAVFTPGAVLGDYESIATVSLTGTQATIEFTSIPSTYQHLQLRIFARDNRATYGISDMRMAVGNGTISTTGYTPHALFGDGANAVANDPGTGTNGVNIMRGTMGTTVTNYFGVAVVDILDYANTNKNKTFRTLSGVDINGTTAGFGGRVALTSGLWANTSAINRIQLTSDFGSFTQYTHVALYGIKG